MNNKIVLNKDVQIEDSMVVITETIKTNLYREEIEMMLRDVDKQKDYIKTQNQRLIDEYNELLEKEDELKMYLDSIKPDIDIEVIE